MKVLLVSLPNKYQDKGRDQVFFPVGLGYIAGALLEDKHEVEILDIYALGLTEEEVVSVIKEKTFDVVAVGAMSTQYKYLKWLAAKIKEFHPHKKIILGWVLASHSAEVVLKTTDIDICVVGEGENTIKELLLNLEYPYSVKGIIYKNKGKIEKNLARDYILDLNYLPRIPYEIFPMDVYISSLAKCGITQGQRTVNISCGRGCPYDCTFCSKSFSGIRLRPVDDIVSEIKFLKNKYDIERIYFSDELVVTSKVRIMEICEKIKPLGIRWSCQGRINLVDQEILKKMKDAGCTAIGYGVESGSQKILDAMNKKINIIKAVEVIKITKKLGLTPYLQFTFGYPGEDLETIKESVEFFNKIDEPAIEFTPITPLPGTKLWDYCINKKIITDEASFLNKLEGGYMPDAPVLVNFTAFSDNQLTSLRKTAEKAIRMNYVKRHPGYVIRKIKDMILNIGFKGTCNKINSLLNLN